MPPADEQFFAEARRMAKASTCLRGEHTGAVIVLNGAIIGIGAPACSPHGELYGTPVQHCPRDACDAKTGECYELCNPIHAEEAALFSALTTLWHLKCSWAAKDQPWSPNQLASATLYLTGHYYPCWRCVAVLRYAGITDIRIDPETARINPNCHHRPPES
ncbi:MAG: hypothetical protein HY475_01510 [Candidatus Terrybacteria bacterium]|nr:hypothetical protein [Candidatus Terrybacteria bacterium]